MSDYYSVLMQVAIDAASRVRHLTTPNPWVGSVVVSRDGQGFVGATSKPGGLHAERHALAQAGDAAVGSTLVTTLEPCGHHGRTGPCTDAIIEAGVATVVMALRDPDSKVAGSGVKQLHDAGLHVIEGVGAIDVERQLRPYLHHRRTGRPYVVVKSAASLDGRTAAPDGSSQWITSPEARADGHRLRAESDAIIVGSGTVQADDPTLTSRDWAPAGGDVWSDDSEPVEVIQPRRIVVGDAPDNARAQPCDTWNGELDDLLVDLGQAGVVQALVEGGAALAGSFHRAGLVNRFVHYLAPAVFGGEDGKPILAGEGAPTIAEVVRGEIVGFEQVGHDLRIDVEIPDG